ncbi:hypothetical protein ACFWPJ_32410, partial [Nocardia sp. NPDC058497]
FFFVSLLFSNHPPPSRGGGGLPPPGPPRLDDEKFVLEQAKKIDEFADRKLQKLTPGEFMEMFYAAVEQDAWLLYVHGGVLGVVVGAIHLLIFGW